MGECGENTAKRNCRIRHEAAKSRVGETRAYPLELFEMARRQGEEDGDAGVHGRGGGKVIISRKQEPPSVTGSGVLTPKNYLNR